MLSNIKLTGFIYAGLMLGGYWLLCLIRKQKHKIIRLLVTGVCLLTLCALTGINPYFTNIKNNHHLLHPFMGSEKIDIITHVIPSSLFSLSPPMRFHFSFFSHTSNQVANTQNIIKIPFSVSDQDRDMGYDTRRGGFGWFGSGIILLGLLFGYIGLFFPSPRKKAIVFIGILALFTVIVNPESWYARYVPQLWIPPLLGAVLFVGEANIKFKKTRYMLSAILLFFVFLNAYYIISQVTNQCLDYTKQVNSIISQMTPSKSLHKVVINDGLSASIYTLWDSGIVCAPCSVNDIPELINSGYIALDMPPRHYVWIMQKNTYFFNPK